MNTNKLFLLAVYIILFDKNSHPRINWERILDVCMDGWSFRVKKNRGYCFSLRDLKNSNLSSSLAN